MSIVESIVEPIVESLMGLSISLLGLNSTIVFDGDSVTAGSLGVNHTAYVADRVGGRLRLVSGYNQAIGGQKVDEVLANINVTLSVSPDILFVFAGGNDLIDTTRTPEEIQNDLRAIYDAAIAAGTRVVAMQYFELGDGVVSVARDLDRVAINTWIESQPDINVVSLSDFDKNTMLLVDGKHPNDLGAKFIGNQIGDELTKLLVNESAFSNALTDQNELHRLSMNPQFAGTGGAKTNNVSGDVPDGWIIDSDADCSISAAISGGELSITLSGTNTVANAFVRLRRDLSSLNIGDEYDARIQCALPGLNTGVDSVYLLFTASSANYGRNGTELGPEMISECVRTSVGVVNTTTERLSFVVNLLTGTVDSEVKLSKPIIEKI